MASKFFEAASPFIDIRFSFAYTGLVGEVVSRRENKFYFGSGFP
jgi:hypothetical protein